MHVLSTAPCRVFYNIGPQNPSIEDSEVHKFGGKADFEAWELRNVWSGNESDVCRTVCFNSKASFIRQCNFVLDCFGKYPANGIFSQYKICI